MTQSPPPADSHDGVGTPPADDTTVVKPSRWKHRPGWWIRFRARVDRSIPLQAGIALGAVLVLFLLVFYGFAVMYVHPTRWWPWSGTGKHGTASLYDLTRNSATVAALLGGAVAIAVALRRQRSTERTVELTEETAQIAAETARIAQDNVKIAQETANITAQAYQLDQSRAMREETDRLRDRYTTTANQLGHEAAFVRLAGVYAMAALADDWLRREDGNHEAQVCIDVLCAYIRTPRHTTTDEDRQADTRVRETITRVIAKHVAQLAQPDWTGRTFDFTGAVFSGTHSFDQTVFRGGQLILAGCQFEEGCRLSFDHAIFEKSHISFFGAEFNDGAVLSFSEANFSDRYQLIFGRAKFNKGCKAMFEAAEFNRGSFLSFRGANFADGCRLSFDEAVFKNRAQMGFTGAHFEHGSQVSFTNVELEDTSRLLFVGLDFGRSWPTGPWGDGQPPQQWPAK